MAFTITVPELGESVLEATVSRWLKHEGDQVNQGEPLVELETDKVNLEVSARESGLLVHIEAGEGQDVKVGDVLGEVDPAGEGGLSTTEPATSVHGPVEQASTKNETPQANRRGQMREELGVGGQDQEERTEIPMPEVTPVARRMAEEQGVDLGRVRGSGPGGRITKGDIEAYAQSRPVAVEAPPAKTAPIPAEKSSAPQPEAGPATYTPAGDSTRPAPVSRPPVAVPPGQGAAILSADNRPEERVKLSRRRRTIAKRLVEAQQTAAMLTTFNEVNMSAVMDLRKRRNEEFQKRYGVKLGFTSFFVKASIGALKAFPRVNAEIQGDEMIVKHYYDIGIAVGAEEGLVVPVLRDADRMTFAAIEKKVDDFVKKAQDNTLSLDDLRGGTFTITNGGVFGSLMSTPILTPPQVGILGLHKIENRPVAFNEDIVIRPMMYVALSYDHRLVDGREAVQFLVRIKQLIEDPESLLLEG